ncbi:MAG: EAL and HDOD domain-containing protein [Burkholderiaceae bacterium]
MNPKPATNDASNSVTPLVDFFLARQPILDRVQSIVAYELLFRSAASGPANVVNDLAATASVIAHASEIGMDEVIGCKRAFINVDETVLMSDIVKILPHKNIVLEILENVEATPEVMGRVRALVALGFTFALDDVIADTLDIQRFLPFVDVVKIDVKDTPLEHLAGLVNLYKRANKKLLAEKVETQALFQYCREIGFDFFQGYYFAHPVILSGKKLAPSQLAVMHLIEHIYSEADDAFILRSIQQDASLSLNLLRLVNTPAVGASRRIDTLAQALLLLGRRQLQRWLQVSMYANAEHSGNVTSPLLMLATIRGKLLELMATKLRPGNLNTADVGFTVGILSLTDVLFGVPMKDLLEQIPVNQEISEALLFRSGMYGDMLRLAELVEKIEDAGESLAPILQKLQLSAVDLYECQLSAFAWSDNISNPTS